MEEVRPSRRTRVRSASDNGPVDWARLFGEASIEAAGDAVRSMLAGPANSARRDDAVRDALEVWSAARERIERMEATLEARSRELALLQTLGQRAAEARSVPELFRGAAEILNAATGAEVLVAVERRGASLDARAFLARPVGDDPLRQLAQETARFVGWDGGAVACVARAPLPTYDPDAWRLRAVREQDIVLLPITRRGTPTAGLALLHPGPPDEARLRVLYGAANQLSLHIDRILTVAEAEQDRFRAILDSMPQAVVLTDPALSVVQANPAGQRLLEALGVAPEGGRLEALGPLHLPTLATGVQRGETASAEAEAGFAGDVFNVTVSALRSEPGEPSGLVVVAADVTESRRLQEQLAQAEKMSSLGQMISGVAHELNNPLASILGYAQLLQATLADERHVKRVETLHQEARRCRRIVQNLLTLARRHEPERKPFSLNEVVDIVLSLMAYQLRVDDVAVATALDRELPRLLGDRHQLQQVLLNLLTNAHHALRAGGRGGRLWVETSRPREGWARLVVEDDGPGVPASIRGRIFDPFFTTKAPGEGTGLGLSLVYGEVRAHGGSIWIEEGRVGGARFVVELPAPGAGEAADGAPAAAPFTAESPAGRVLVVDDESALAEVMREALESEGHEVEVATDGRSALDRLGGGGFDAVVLDYRMPGLDGPRLLEEVRRRHPAIGARVILTTGDTVSREPDAFAQRTGIAMLRKPFELADLKRAVASTLRSEAAD